MDRRAGRIAAAAAAVAASLALAGCLPGTGGDDVQIFECPVVDRQAFECPAPADAGAPPADEDALKRAFLRADAGHRDCFGAWTGTLEIFDRARER